MSVDRITDQNITSSSPTSSLFLNSTRKTPRVQRGVFLSLGEVVGWERSGSYDGFGTSPGGSAAGKIL